MSAILHFKVMIKQFVLNQKTNKQVIKFQEVLRKFLKNRVDRYN